MSLCLSTTVRLYLQDHLDDPVGEALGDQHETSVRRGDLATRCAMWCSVPGAQAGEEKKGRGEETWSCGLEEQKIRDALPQNDD